MSGKRKKVMVAMSGGVDSSVTAGMLVQEGYEVEGVSLRLWEGERQGPRNCSDHIGAADVAELLGIPHFLLDLRKQFAATVVRPFAEEYLRGCTPNPCVACNRDFKLGTLLDWARQHGADYVATGHYARIVRDPLTRRASLFRGADRGKDQSYFLFALSQDQLANTLFPLGDLQKQEVRERANQLGLPVADRSESQDICFGDYKALVESFSDRSSSGGGEIVDRSGTVLGRHSGIHRVTVGQRRGLGISAPQPLYVLAIEESSRRVVVGKREELGSQELIARAVHWIEGLAENEFAAEVQLRYRSPAIPCRVRSIGGGSWEVGLQERFPAVTPGQAAVFYRGEQLLGGGWIEKSLSS